MKNARQCLKCESLNVVYYSDYKEQHYGDIMTYMCVDCGYQEQYRRFPAQYAQVREKMSLSGYPFGRVNPEPDEKGPYR